MIRFFVVAITVFIILILAVRLGTHLGWWQPPLFGREILFFLLGITLVIGYNLMRLQKKQPRHFIQFYLLSIALKMIAGLAFIFFLIQDTPAQTGRSAALFIIAYILFTGVEVLFLVRKQP